EHRGATCDQGGCRLPDGDGEREVPGRDQRHGADGLAQREAEGAAHLRRQRLAMLAETLARIELEDVQASQHLAPRLVEDLSLLAAERLGDEVHLLLQDRVGACEDPPALRPGRRGPAGERLGGSVDRRLRVRGTTFREVAEDLARVGGIHTWVILVGGWRYPCAADEVLPPLV